MHFRRVYIIIRSFLFRILNRQFLIFLFFLFLSAAFWLFVSLDEDYEADFIVPIHLKNVPENVVITTDLARELHVTLKDKGATLLNYKYGQKIAPVVVDFEEYANHSGHSRFLTSDLVRQVVSQLSSATKIVSVKPDTLEFYFNYGLFKRVPVRIQGTIHTDSHYYLSTVSVKPDSVAVYAIRSILDTITAAYTRPLYVRNLTDTMTMNVELSRVKGAKFEPSRVKVSLFAEQMTEKTVQVPVQWVNFPATKSLRTFPSKVNVTFQVGMAMYRRITAADFVLVVNYEELLENRTNKCRLSLKTIPTGVTHVRIYPQEVDYLIEDVSPEN